MSKSALILLDFINGITASAKDFLAENDVIGNANKLIKYARENNFPVIFVKVGFSENYAELAANSPVFSKIKENSFLKLGSPSTEFHPDLDYQTGDLVVIKHRFSAFYATSLEAILTAQDIDHLILGGISTHVAVSSTARDAHDRNFKVTVVADACGTANKVTHDNEIAIMGYFTQVVSTQEFCKSSSI